MTAAMEDITSQLSLAKIDNGADCLHVEESASHAEHSLERRLREIVEAGCGEGLFFCTEQEKKDSGFFSKLTHAADDLGLSISTVYNIPNSLPLSRGGERGNVEVMAGKDECLPILPIYLVRKHSSNNFIEIRIAVIGNVDAGKSSMLGVLTKGILDDGRGRARVGLLRHKHEIETGRTSSIGSEILGFDHHGSRVETLDVRGKKMSWDDICESSSKIISFMDLAGHERYLKTTMFGLTGYAPDYSMLIMGSNAGLIGMAKEHLALTFALNVPVMIVITKIDMTPPNIAEENLRHLMKLLKSPNCQRTPIVIRNIREAVYIMKNFICERYCPIFQISNVSGVGLPLLSQFLNLIPSRLVAFGFEKPYPLFIEYQITEVYDVHGVGTVVAGTLICGLVMPGQTLFLGPDAHGAFIETQVKSIQRKRMNVGAAYTGQTITFALRKISRAQIKKGMVLVSSEPHGSFVSGGKARKKGINPLNSNALPPPIAVCYEFSAEVLILFHATTITLKYQAMLHCGVIRQTVSIVGIEQYIRSTSSMAMAKAAARTIEPPSDGHHYEILRTGDRAIVRFRFIKKPEYLKMNMRLLFREGKTKGVGKVIRLYPDAAAHTVMNKCSF